MERMKSISHDALCHPKHQDRTGTMIRLCFLAVLLGSTACNGGAETIATPAPTAPPWVGDTFFSGQAFLDTDADGQRSAADTPLPDAMFIARDARGAEMGHLTEADGTATVSFPGGVVYPVILRMKPPEGSNLVLIGSTEVVLKDTAGSSAKFLFAEPRVTPSR